MIDITALQLLFGFTAAWLELFDQNSGLAHMVVVTNIMPFILLTGAVAMIMKKADVPYREAKQKTAISFTGIIYISFAIALLRIMEVFWKSVLAFFGWISWGFTVNKFLYVQDQAL